MNYINVTFILEYRCQSFRVTWHGDNKPHAKLHPTVKLILPYARFSSENIEEAFDNVLNALILLKTDPECLKYVSFTYETLILASTDSLLKPPPSQGTTLEECFKQVRKKMKFHQGYIYEFTTNSLNLFFQWLSLDQSDPDVINGRRRAKQDIDRYPGKVKIS